MDRIIRGRPGPAPGRPEGGILRCACTGYRPHKLPFGSNEEDLRCVEFKQRIGHTLELLVRDGYSHFLTGGALGFDTFAAEAVMTIRRKCPWVALEVAVPYDAQAEQWAFFSRERYMWILNQADIVTWISHAYTDDCLRRRNRYLVDRCDLLLAAYDGKPGGTAQTVAYARARSREIRFIPPVLKGTRRGAWYYGDGEAPAAEARTEAFCG